MFYSLLFHIPSSTFGFPAGGVACVFFLGKITAAAALHGPFGSFLAGLSCPFGKVRQGKGGIALSWRITQVFGFS